MTIEMRMLLRLACTLLLPAAVFAQQRPDPRAYAYRAEGRRDPFVSLVGRGAEPGAETNRPAGLRGLTIGEVALKGIMKDRSGFIALLHGPDKRTYTVRAGQKLLDGSVKTVTAEAVVFAQDVEQPLAGVTQREIVKKLRADDGGGE